jgi:hypothetical protein
MLSGKAAFMLSERTGSGHDRGLRQLLFDAISAVPVPNKY